MGFESFKNTEQFRSDYTQKYESINSGVDYLVTNTSASKDTQFKAELTKLRTTAATLADNAANLQAGSPLEKKANEFLGSLQTLISTLNYASKYKKTLSQAQLSPMIAKVTTSHRDLKILLSKNNTIAQRGQLVAMTLSAPLLLAGCANTVNSPEIRVVNTVRTSNSTSSSNTEYTQRTSTTINGKTTETFSSNIEFSGKSVPVKLSFIDKNNKPIRTEGLGASISAFSQATADRVKKSLQPQSTKKKSGGGNLEDAFTDTNGAIDETFDFLSSASKKWILTITNSSGLPVDTVVLDQPTMQKYYKSGTLVIPGIQLTRIDATKGF